MYAHVIHKVFYMANVKNGAFRESIISKRAIKIKYRSYKSGKLFEAVIYPYYVKDKFKYIECI